MGCLLKKNSFYHTLVFQGLLQFLFLMFCNLSRLQRLWLISNFDWFITLMIAVCLLKSYQVVRIVLPWVSVVSLLLFSVSSVKSVIALFMVFASVSLFGNMLVNTSIEQGSNVWISRLERKQIHEIKLMQTTY